MLKIGLTGGIGSGKTTVAGIVEAIGYPVFYSDDEAKRIIDNDPEVKHDLISLVGEQLYSDGKIIRPVLADAIFRNPSLRNDVNAIIHPKVRQAFAVFCMMNNDRELVFNEAAILFETGIYKNFDKTILVTAPEEIRISRVMSRDEVSADKVRDRMKAQWTDEKKTQLADFIINNDGTAPLLAQVEEIIDQLISS